MKVQKNDQIVVVKTKQGVGVNEKAVFGTGFSNNSIEEKVSCQKRTVYCCCVTVNCGGAINVSKKIEVKVEEK